jgi:hypothetical protein
MSMTESICARSVPDRAVNGGSNGDPILDGLTLRLSSAALTITLGIVQRNSQPEDALLT